MKSLRGNEFNQITVRNVAKLLDNDNSFSAYGDDRNQSLASLCDSGEKFWPGLNWKLKGEKKNENGFYYRSCLVPTDGH